MSLGGRTVRAGLNVYRYANRIPLLFESSSDVIFKTANEIKWAAYKINKNDDKIGVFVSIVSTKIPFKVNFQCGLSCSFWGKRCCVFYVILIASRLRLPTLFPLLNTAF